MQAKELLEIKALIVALVKAGKGIMADGKVGLEDLGHLMVVVPHVGPAIEGAGDALAEAASLSEEDMKALVADLVVELGLESEKVASLVKASFNFLHAGFKLYKAIA